MSPNPTGKGGFQIKNGEKKEKRLEIRLNEPEYELIDNLAKKYGLSKSELILLAVNKLNESQK